MFVIAASFPLETMAQNQVYDPLPPPGSAYVRFVNATEKALVLTTDFLAAQPLGISPAQRVTSFTAVEKVTGRRLLLDIQVDGKGVKATLKAEPGSYVTVLIEADPEKGLVVVPIVDITEFNQSRARLSFYNATLTCASASLVIDPDGPVVFPDVGVGAVKSRSVNPVVAKIHAACGGASLASIPLEGMEAGAMYSVWMMGAGVQPQTFVTRDTTAKYKQ